MNNLSIKRSPWLIMALLSLCHVGVSFSSCYSQTSTSNRTAITEGLAPQSFGAFTVIEANPLTTGVNGLPQAEIFYRHPEISIPMKVVLHWKESQSHPSDSYFTYLYPDGFADLRYRGELEKPPLPDRKSATVRDKVRHGNPAYHFFSRTHIAWGEIHQSSLLGGTPKQLLSQSQLDSIANDLRSRLNRRAVRLPVQLLAAKLPTQFAGLVSENITYTFKEQSSDGSAGIRYVTKSGKNALLLNVKYYTQPTDYSSRNADVNKGNASNDARRGKVVSDARILGAGWIRYDQSIPESEVRKLAQQLVRSYEPFACKRPRPLLTSGGGPSSVNPNESAPPLTNSPSTSSLSTGVPSDGSDAGSNQAADREQLQKDKEQKTREVTAVASILVALILAGLAGGLNLSQAIAIAIVDAVRAGVEVTTESVVDAISTLPDPNAEPNSDSNDAGLFTATMVSPETAQSGASGGTETEPPGMESPGAESSTQGGTEPRATGARVNNEQTPAGSNAPNVPAAMSEGSPEEPAGNSTESKSDTVAKPPANKIPATAQTQEPPEKPSTQLESTGSEDPTADQPTSNTQAQDPPTSAEPSPSQTPSPEGNTEENRPGKPEGESSQDGTRGGIAVENEPTATAPDDGSTTNTSSDSEPTSTPNASPEPNVTGNDDQTPNNTNSGGPENPKANDSTDPEPPINQAGENENTTGSTSNAEPTKTQEPESPEKSRTPDNASSEGTEPNTLAGEAPGQTTPQETNSVGNADTEPAPTSTTSEQPEALGKLRDPATGHELVPDENGLVSYGGSKITPEEAKWRTEMDADARRREAAAKQRVDDYKSTVDRLNQETDPEKRAKLEADRRRQANDLLGDYDGRSTLKADGRTIYSESLDNTIAQINQDVDADHIDALNSMGVKKGGNNLDGDALIDFRNSASKGTVPTDRDRGLNETDYKDALQQMNNAKPGSDEAHEAAQRLAAARRAGQLSIDPNAHQDFLGKKRVTAQSSLDSINQRIDTLPSDSPERPALEQQRQDARGTLDKIAKQQADFDGLKSRNQALVNARVEELNRTLAKHPADSPQADRIRQSIDQIQNQKTIPISKTRFGTMAQETYDEAFQKRTGKNATGALQAVTTGQSADAYGDAKVLKGVSPDNLPDPRRAAQTASVSRFKANDNQHLVAEGHFTKGQAIKETARGYAKDMATKWMPLVNSDPNITPQRADQLNRIHGVLDEVGKGKIPPGQADLKLQQALPEIQGMNLRKATTMVDANAEAAMKWRRPARATGAAGVSGDLLTGALDAKGTVDEFGKLRAKGANVVDAAATAGLKTAIGNQVYATQPGIGMAGALLPTGARKVLPNEFAGDALDAGRLLLAGASKDAGNASVTGKISGTHFTDAAEKIAKRGGTVGGYGRAGAFLGDEFSRAQQQAPDEGFLSTGRRVIGNLADDVNRIIDTGVASEVANEAKDEAGRYVREDLVPDALAGKHGTPLQGYAQATSLLREIAKDPMKYAEDSRALQQEGWVFDRDGNFGNGLAFDPELQRQVGSNIDQTLSGTPLVNVPYEGLRDLGKVVVDPKFRDEMREGFNGLVYELGDFMLGGTVTPRKEDK